MDKEEKPRGNVNREPNIAEAIDGDELLKEAQLSEWMMLGSGDENDAILQSVLVESMREFAEATATISARPADSKGTEKEEKMEEESQESQVDSGESDVHPVEEKKKFVSPSDLISEDDIDDLVFHKAAFFGDDYSIRSVIAQKHKIAYLNALDSHGYSPLLLALVMNNESTAHTLLDAGADPTIRSRKGFTPLQVAASISRSRALMTDVYLHSILARRAEWESRLPNLLSHLQETDDFYMELKFEISSWIPGLKHVAPKDTFKITKRGASLKFEMSLIGFEGLRPQRGHIAFLFSADNGLPPQQQHEEETQQQRVERMHQRSQIGLPIHDGDGANNNDNSVGGVKAWLIDFKEGVYQDALEFLRTPSYEHLMEKVASSMESQQFLPELVTSGAVVSPKMGWTGKPKTEKIGEFGTSLHNVKGIEFAAVRRKAPSGGYEEVAARSNSGDGDRGGGEMLSFEEYFESNTIRKVGGGGGDQKKEKKEVEENTKFKSLEDICGLELNVLKSVNVTLNLTDSFPLPLETVREILSILSQTNTHISQLEHVFRLDYDGFPVKLEIPIEMGINAVVTFSHFERKTVPEEEFALPRSFMMVDNLIRTMGG